MSAPRNSLAKLVERLGPNISPEQKQLVEKLEAWDTNGDGSYSAEEAAPRPRPPRSLRCCAVVRLVQAGWVCTGCVPYP